MIEVHNYELNKLSVVYGGSGASKETTSGLFDPTHAPMVDLHSTAKFEEPFYITLLEKTPSGSVS